MNSSIPSSRQSTAENSKPAKTKPAWIFLFVSFAGFLDSSYLAAKHWLGGPVPCALFEGCEKVLSSSYSVIFGVPVALAGALYYLVFFILTVFYLDTRRERIVRLLSYFSIAGLAASLWFVYLQFFVIKSVCEFCLLSALTSILLFVLGLIYLLKYRNPRVVDIETSL